MANQILKAKLNSKRVKRPGGLGFGSDLTLTDCLRVYTHWPKNPTLKKKRLKPPAVSQLIRKKYS